MNLLIYQHWRHANAHTGKATDIGIVRTNIQRQPPPYWYALSFLLYFFLSFCLLSIPLSFPDPALISLL
jgi:hypothetical protein